MRMLIIAAACLGIVGCASPVPSNPVPVESSGGIASGTVIDEKALYVAEAAFNVVAQTYVVTDSKGLLPAATKAKLKPYMLEAYDALKLARKAYAIGDNDVFTQQIARLNDYLDLAKTLLPAIKGS